MSNILHRCFGLERIEERNDRQQQIVGFIDHGTSSGEARNACRSTDKHVESAFFQKDRSFLFLHHVKKCVRLFPIDAVVTHVKSIMKGK